MPLIAPFLLAITATLPTMQEIQADFDAKKYPETIREVAQVMPTASKADSTYDRGKLWALSAESHLNLSHWAQASQGYTSAAAAETADDKAASLDKAMSILVKRSTGGKFTAKQPSTLPSATGKNGPIDIVDPATRKEALAALLNDESVLVKARVAALSKTTNLPQMVNGIKQLSDYRAVEVAATGDDADFKSMISSITGGANKAIADQMKKMTELVDTIARTANTPLPSETTNIPGMPITSPGKAGLTSADRNNLNQVIATTKGIDEAVDAFNKATNSASTDLTATGKEATALEKKATDVLLADYSSQIVNTPPTVIQNPGAGQPRR